MSNSNRELETLHRLLIRARMVAYEGKDFPKVARLLDDAEYLVTLLARGDSEAFARYARGISESVLELRGIAEGLTGHVAA